MRAVADLVEKNNEEILATRQNANGGILINDEDFIPFQFPQKYTKEVLDLIIKRAEMIEGETLKDATGLNTKIGAASAGAFGLFGAIIAARDTLFFHAMSEYNIFVLAAFIEATLILAAMSNLFRAYNPFAMKIDPDLRRGDIVARIIEQDEIAAKTGHLQSLLANVVLNQHKIKQQTIYITRGFKCLFWAALLILTHTTVGGIMKSEAERLAKPATSQGGSKGDQGSPAGNYPADARRLPGAGHSSAGNPYCFAAIGV